MTQITANSLLVRCGIAAAIYYVPQDLGVLSILGFNKHSCSRQIAGPAVPGPAEDKLERVLVSYMMDRGLNPSEYSIDRTKYRTVVQLR
ncbi:hypothetical protein X943_001382 [Babesia divergens]|uniref:Uncharacterized protein n=1 Tax=Babesia divergens TaxID=32595 RepID=A0AAD9GJI2_BABDI|nr:hypothetical protein X943_001382 [Babesia divergens]